MRAASASDCGASRACIQPSSARTAAAVEHALRRAADAHDEVEIATRTDRPQAALHVAVLEELDGCPRRAGRADVAVVPRPLLHGDPHVGRGDAPGLGDPSGSPRRAGASSRSPGTLPTSFSM